MLSLTTTVNEFFTAIFHRYHRVRPALHTATLRIVSVIVILSLILLNLAGSTAAASSAALNRSHELGAAETIVPFSAENTPAAQPRVVASDQVTLIDDKELLAQAAATGGSTTRVSVASDGTEGDSFGSGSPAISADGRYVAFDSFSGNLVSGDTNGALFGGGQDVFVHDRQTRQTTRVSIASNGAQGNRASVAPAISADGRYVAFSSIASTLVSNDTNGNWDVFVHDRQTGQTSRVSVVSGGSQANGSFEPRELAISADGRYVAFSSWSSNLVSGDTNNAVDIFIHDRQTGQTTRVSVASDGTQGLLGSTTPAISTDGRYVAFDSFSSNLVSDDTNNSPDVFVHDRQTGQTTRVSVASDRTQGEAGSGSPAISPDGRYITFLSNASNLVSGDTNGRADSFVHDRQSGQTTRVSVASNGTQGNGESLSLAPISADGRYVAFSNLSSNLVSNDSNNFPDIFVHDRQTGQTTRVSVASDGTQANHTGRTPAISADGRYVAFGSGATNLVSGDTNNASDVFVHARGSEDKAMFHPLIFVPGFGGTELYNMKEDPDKLVWLDAWSLVDQTDDEFLDDLQLDETGAKDLGDNAIQAKRVIRKIGPKDVYDSFVDYLTSPQGIPSDFPETSPYVLGEVGGEDFKHVINYAPGQNFWLFPVDFRKDLTDAANRLDFLVNEVRAVTGAEKVDLVAHSQGGIVIREYIANQSHPDRAGKVNNYITLGTPYLGVPMVFRALRYGWDFAIPAGFLNSQQGKKISQNAFGAYEMLPANDAFFALFTDGYFKSNWDLNDDDQDEDNLITLGAMDSFLRSPSILDYPEWTTTTHYNAFLVNQGRYFQERGIQGWRSPQTQGVHRHVIVGSGICTVRRFVEQYFLLWSYVALQLGNGDDLVLTRSGNMGKGEPADVSANVPISYVHDIPHGELPNRLGKEVVAILIGRPLDALPGSLLHEKRKSKKCTSVDTLSPVDLHMTDAAGNHTGLLATAPDYEAAIPFSQFFLFEHNQTTVVPSGGPYNIALDGTGDGTFGLRVREWENEGIIGTLLYQDVPVNPNSNARLNYTTGGAPPVLELDYDGDGVFEMQVPPASVLGPQDAQFDFEGPSTTVQAEGMLGANGYYISDVTLTLTAQDNEGGSGVLNTHYSLDGGATFAPYTAPLVLDRDGAITILPQTSDRVGNKEGQPAPLTVQIDKTAPVVTMTGVSNDAAYTLGSVPPAGCDTQDATSGVATPAMVTVTGGNPDGTGSFTATCSGASDYAGNTGSATVNYTVIYNWAGFFQPVDNLPMVNTVNAGLSIPVKFSLSGAFGLNILASGYPKVQTVACGSGGSAGSDAIEETVTTSNSGLQYDPATNIYTYVWKTDKAWAGSCRQLVVRLIDGTDHIALFQFNGQVRSTGEIDEGPAEEAAEGEAQLIFLPLVAR